jgi:hypothetical protein
VSREQFRLVFNNLTELAFKYRGNASVERASGLAQQGAVSGILHERVLEQVGCMRRHALSEK